MINKVADLGLRDACKNLEGEALLAKIDEILKEKLNIGLETIKKPMLQNLIANAEEIVLEMPNIAPMGDYGKLLEDNDSMAQFLKTEAAKSEHWFIYDICDEEKFPNLLKFTFICKAIDDGDTMKGTVFVSKAGVVKHAFVQAVG